MQGLILDPNSLTLLLQYKIKQVRKIKSANSTKKDLATTAYPETTANTLTPNCAENTPSMAAECQEDVIVEKIASFYTLSCASTQ